MIKIMLVEDDKSLREIYGVRLLAEGYDIVSAGDGEEALAMAIKERPQLIISDVMMPKVSGYDMLDILRSTTETRNIRVIMMTALSSDEQRTRAESLGADRYLVKSQVGIEDVVRVVHDVLEDTPAAATAAPAPVATPAQAPSPQPAPNAPAVAPSAIIPAAAPQPTMPAPRPFVAQQTPKPASSKSRIIQPLNDPNATPVNINELLDKELAKEAGITEDALPVVESTSQERATLEEQLRAFSASAPEPTPVTMPNPAPAAGVPDEGTMTMSKDIPVFDPGNDMGTALPPPPPAPVVPLTPAPVAVPAPPVVPLAPAPTPPTQPQPSSLPTPGIVTPPVPQPLPSIPVVNPTDVTPPLV